MARNSGGDGGVLSQRALNRALLARQMLLERADMPALDAVGHLVGMQAQSPLAPYVGLWARLKEFDPAGLAGPIEDRKAVRLPVMRTTLHLVGAEDALRLWPLMRIVLARGFSSSPFGKKVAGVDIEAVIAAGRKALAEQPTSNARLGEILATRWPGVDGQSLAYAVHYLSPLVQTPPRGIWGKGGLPTLTPLQEWLGCDLDETYAIDAVALRYLAAFGPASVMDFQAWCWLTRQAATFERLRPKLVTFRDDKGRELFDLPDAPRPPEDTPALVRFIPEYDNLLLSHDDRSRVITEPHLKRVFGKGGVLVDGFAAGAWKIVRARKTATLQIEAFGKLSRRDTAAIEAEGERLLRFAAAEEKERSIQFVEG